MSHRAMSIPHAEYEILQVLLNQVDLSNLRAAMGVGKTAEEVEHAEDRFDKAAKNVLQFVDNLAKRRTHKLPKSHADYTGE